MEKRILRAIVHKTFRKRTAKSECNKYGLVDFTSGSIIAKINEDYQSSMNGITIPKKDQTKSRINSQTIAEAVFTIKSMEFLCLYARKKLEKQLLVYD